MSKNLKVVISDSSPLISFCRAGKLSLLHQIFSELIIPEAVYAEITREGKNKPGAREIAESSWICIYNVKNPGKKNELPPTLGEGEKEAIILARELGGILLIDERRARIEAKSRGIRLVSSLDVLSEAKQQKKIASVKETLDEFIHAGFRLSEQLYCEILHRVGEL